MSELATFAHVLRTPQQGAEPPHTGWLEWALITALSLAIVACGIYLGGFFTL